MKMRGAKILLKVLEEEGVDTIFGYPGGAVLDIYDELYRTPGIRHIRTHHEQGAAHAADGYARASGKVGVCLVTSGPGATNTVTGIATAYMDSVPMVILTGQVPTKFIGTDAFQESDITGITRPCTKHNTLVRRIEDLAPTVREAFAIARSGRPGPVLIDLPKDVMQAETEYMAPEKPGSFHDAPAAPVDEEALQQAFRLLRESKRPIIIVGGGIVMGKASEELKSLVETISIPVASTLMGLGAFPGTHPLWLGMLGMHGTYYANMAVSNCDLLMTLGARFSDRVTGKIASFAPHAKSIQIDIDAASINKVVDIDVPVVGDCKTFLSRLIELCREAALTVRPEDRTEWLNDIAQWRKKTPLNYTKNGRIKPQEVIETLQRLTDGKAIICTEVGQNQMWTAQFYRFTEPQTFLTSGGLGTMGYGFPAAIGAQVACPDKTVVDIAGDGSIQMNIQELATAVGNNLPVKIIILNNGCLGMVHQWQEIFYGKRYSHTEIGDSSPDFVKLAEAYGAVGLRASRPEEIEPVLRKALETPRTVIAEFIIDPSESVFPMVSPGGALTDMRLENIIAHD
ncbi:MAG: biosynthetic-type acetolactate synthase large subunit [Deltaproteobacteria bacterium]|nr:biosynthetic-type acetolactate synthase large subunit [Deltaproteobacteria bacterium]